MVMGRDYSAMSTQELQDLRQLVLDRMAAVPEFRRGSLQVGYRKCGSKTCRCARPGERGHGPRGLWTRTAKGSSGSGSRGQYIPVEQVDQVRAELDNYAQFAQLVEDYVEINEALCTAKIGPPPGRSKRTPPAKAGGKKRGSGTSRAIPTTKR